MKKDQTFIQSLKGWLSGNAGLKEERALQQLAQDDPFLSDALEGYQLTAAEDHEKNLQQIRKRLAGKAEKRRLVPIWMRVAAGGAILVAALFALRWVNATGADQIGQYVPEASEEMQTEDPPSTALEDAVVAAEESPKVTTEEEAPAPATSPASTEAKPQAPSQERASNRPKGQIDKERKKSSRQDASIASKSLSPTQAARERKTKTATPATKKTAPVQQAAAAAESGRSTGVNKEEKAIRLEEFSEISEEMADEEVATEQEALPPSPSPMRIPSRNISGTVTDPNGQPLIGVTVNIPGTQMGTVTNIDGEYQLPLKASPKQLKFSYTGFESTLVPLAQTDTYNIQLIPAETLSEVVITGYGKQKAKKRDRSSTALQVRLKATGISTIRSEGATPIGGLEQLNRTIRQKGKKFKADYSQLGKSVSLTFQLTPDHKVTAISVVEGQDAALNQEAIRLIQLTAWQLKAGYEKSGAQVYCKLQF